MSTAASWSRARLSSTAVAPSASSATIPDSPNSRSTRSSWPGSPSRTTSGTKARRLTGSPAARARGSSCLAGTTPLTRSVSRLCADCSSQVCAETPPSMRCSTSASAARSASSRPVAVSPRYPHSMICPHRSPRPPSSARIQPSPALPPAWRAMRSQSRSTSSTADRSPAVARTRWAMLVTTTGHALCEATSSRSRCSGAPAVMSPVSAVRTASERLTAANFLRTSRHWTSSVSSAKGKGRCRTTMGSPHRSAARRITSGGAGKARPRPRTTAAASARCRDRMYSACLSSSPASSTPVVSTISPPLSITPTSGASATCTQRTGRSSWPAPATTSGSPASTRSRVRTCRTDRAGSEGSEGSNGSEVVAMATFP